MPYAKPEVRTAEWSGEDYFNRFGELRTDFASLSEKDRKSDEYRTGKQAMLDEIDDLDVEYGLVLSQEKRTARPASGPNAATMNMSVAEIRSVGELVVADAAFSEWMKRGARGDSPQVELRTLVSEIVGASGANLLLPVGQPFLGNVNEQRLFIRDLLAVGTTGLAQIPYVRELNAVSNQTSASTVAEGVAKPEATIQFSADVAPTTVIAVNLPVTTQVMEDSATVVSYINGRLGYMLKLREEAEILSGNGIYPDLKGLLNFAGIQSQSAVSGEFAITIANAIAKIELVNGMADGLAINPSDFWSYVTHRAASGAGTFDAGTFASLPVNTLWGLPVVRTNSLAAGTALVGAYKTGAQLFDRLQANVRVFDQHSDFAVKNQVLIQAEERIALADYRPDWFVKTTLA